MHHCLHREPPRSRVTRSARRTVRRSAASLRPLSSVVAKRAMRSAMRSVDTAPVPHARDRGRSLLARRRHHDPHDDGIARAPAPERTKRPCAVRAGPAAEAGLGQHGRDRRGMGRGICRGTRLRAFSSIHVRLHEPAQARRRLPRKMSCTTRVRRRIPDAVSVVPERRARSSPSASAVA